MTDDIFKSAQAELFLARWEVLAFREALQFFRLLSQRELLEYLARDGGMATSDLADAKSRLRSRITSQFSAYRGASVKTEEP